jgi:hypothetical protein
MTTTEANVRCLQSLWRQLWTQLRGDEHLWHQTSLPALEVILRDQQIIPNTGQLPVTYPQSRNGYAWHLGAVSLFDFDTSDEQRALEEIEIKWSKPVEVLIGVQRDVLERDKLLLQARSLVVIAG